MGILQVGLDQLAFVIHTDGKKYEGLSMCELGNQHLFLDGPGRPAKPHFESLGVRHTSIDINGLDGALPLDLTHDLTNTEHRERYDVVTDFGTSEHVPDAYACHRNIHYFCKPNGIIFHVSPKTGHWPEHGYHYMSQDSVFTLAKLCGYEILMYETMPALGNITSGWQCHFAYKRPAGEFITREQFNTVPILKS